MGCSKQAEGEQPVPDVDATNEPAKPRRLRRVWLALIIFALAAPVVLYIVQFIFPSTELWCGYTDIDISTGRIRHRRYLVFCRVSERIEDSTITRLLPVDLVAAASAEWHRVHSNSPGIIKHHVYGGAISQMRVLEMLWESLDAPIEVRRKMALHILDLWKCGCGYHTAQEYINYLVFIPYEGRDELFEAILALPTPVIPNAEKEGEYTYLLPNGKPMSFEN